MKPMMTIETYEQLKSLSDPLRGKMMMYLCERAYTGQQLSEKLDIPRGKIHYHLKDLQKNNLIEMVKTEEKNGILQKFYQSVADGFTISDKFLPYKKEISQTTRQILSSILDRTKHRIWNAPDDAFEEKNHSENPEEWGYMATSWEIDASEEQFLQWRKKYTKLMQELVDLGKEETSEKKNTYFFFKLGFQISESEFNKRIEPEED